MTVTAAVQDAEARTLTMTAEYAAPVERVWRMWADPRLLERWWGPPTYPATVVEHDLAPGGTVRYFMTGPEGDTHHGWWRVLTVQAPHSLEFEDGFADADGNPNPDLPVTRGVVTLEPLEDERTRMTIVSTYPSAEAMAQVMAMGMVEGITAAMNQIDGLLAEG
ncbi:MAG: SRPBCC domain-containing protein [Candidatus Nanopelagicales bacterium]